MTVLAVDLGGTKLSLAVFEKGGEILHRKIVTLDKRAGEQIGDLMVEEIQKVISIHPSVQSIGIAVPGIYRSGSGSVWAPNIPQWDDYPLMQKIVSAVDIPVMIDSDRAAYILGEWWMGNAKGCSNAIFLAVGTGIGAGILINGEVLRGTNDIAGALGWMALKPPFEQKYVSCGCFEYYASGEGIARLAKEILQERKNYSGELVKLEHGQLRSHDVFSAFEKDDVIAKQVFSICIQYWGMAIANLVSIFNPEKIILGGGVFGPAIQFIPDIVTEAQKWAQPISITKVIIEPSSLDTDAGLYGAGWLGWKAIENQT